MNYKIKKEDKVFVDEILSRKGFKARWVDSCLICSPRYEDEIFDILCDFNIDFIQLHNKIN